MRRAQIRSDGLLIPRIASLHMQIPVMPCCPAEDYGYEAERASLLPQMNQVPPTGKKAFLSKGKFNHLS
jgi:hypothetical protein